jgi:nucleotide-binding universal stress UspA family protein
VHTTPERVRRYGRAPEAERLAEWMRSEDDEALADAAARVVDPLRLDGVDTATAEDARAGVTALLRKEAPDLICLASRGRTCAPHVLLGIERRLRPHVVVARTHGRGAFDPAMLGSVSELLARRCAAAVLIHPKRDP